MGVGDYVAGLLIGASFGISITAWYFDGRWIYNYRTGNKMIDTLLDEREDLKHSLCNFKVNTYNVEVQTSFLDRIKELNRKIDEARKNTKNGPCNICQGSGIIISDNDNQGVYSVCVKCIHDELMAINAKKQWDISRSSQSSSSTNTQ